MKIELSATIANFNEIPKNDLLVYLKEKNPNIEFTPIVPPKGQVVNYAYEWRAVLDNTTSILAFAAALWTFYEAIIKPKMTKNKTGGISVYITNNKTVNKFPKHIMIGDQVITKEELVKALNTICKEDEPVNKE